MNLIKHFFLITFLLSSLTIFGQAPEQFKYQAAARDAAGAAICNQSVSVRISMHASSASGTVAYQETHTATTNSVGVFSLSVGGGTATTGTFTSIEWGSNPYFMQIELDATGGSSYIDMGTTQLLSVPYALHAKTVKEILPGGTNGQVLTTNGNGGYNWADGGGFPTGGTAGQVLSTDGAGNLSWTDGGGLPAGGLNGQVLTADGNGGYSWVDGGTCTYEIGQTRFGGIIFWVDNTGCHGLVASLTDQSINNRWANTSKRTGASFSGIYQGQTNTRNAIARLGNRAAGSAAFIADALVTGGYDDWYLPASYELILMYKNLHIKGLGNFAKSGSGQYWSSTENRRNRVYNLFFKTARQKNSLKRYGKHIRAIRRF